MYCIRAYCIGMMLNEHRCYIVDPFASLYKCSPSPPQPVNIRVVGGASTLLSELGVLPSHSTTSAITSFGNTVNSIKYILGASYVWHYMEERVVDSQSCCMQYLHPCIYSHPDLVWLGCITGSSHRSHYSQRFWFHQTFQQLTTAFFSGACAWHPSLVSSSADWTGQM